MTLTGCWRALSTTLLVVVPTAAAQANDTSFLSGPELGARLLSNVVRIASLDINEHGFGWVVSVQSRHVLVATARHVVLPRPQPGAPAPSMDPANRQIEVSFCAGDTSGVPSTSLTCARVMPVFSAATCSFDTKLP